MIDYMQKMSYRRFGAEKSTVQSIYMIVRPGFNLKSEVCF